MFENFKTPMFYLANQAALTLYSNGLVSGLVFNSGEGASHAVPIHAGKVVSKAIQTLELSGRDLTLDLMLSLSNKGWDFSTTAERELVRDMKEKHAYVAMDYEKEIDTFSSSFEKTYTLPDSQVVRLGKERFSCPEALFNPAMIGVKGDGIHNSICKSIHSCDEAMHQCLYSHITLAGGNTMFAGLDQRLRREIASLAPAGVNVDVIAPTQRKYSVWLGGSILACLSSFQSMWITKQEYEEHGDAVVHRKCP